MPKTRFQRLPKKDREFVVRYVEAHPDVNESLPDRFGSARRSLANNIAGLHTRPSRKGYSFNTSAELCASTLNILAGEVTQRSIATRLLKDDPTMLVEGLQLVSRLNFVANLAKTPAYSGTDCQHVFDVLTSLAANDAAVLPAYSNRYNFLAKNGHPFTKLLCNAVMMLLRAEMDDQIVANLQTRKDSAHNQSMQLAIAAIARLKSDDVTAHLDTMLTSHRRKSGDDALLRFFSVSAHGIYNLALLHFNANDAIPPSQPTNSTWDSEFQQCVRQHPFVEHPDIISILSPQFGEWAGELPVSVESEIFDTLFDVASTT